MRIFRDYAAGQSSRAIAWALNRDGIPGPFGRAWGPSTIHGNPKRGNGILNNELYIGRLVWNRQRFIKDPETGKRVSRPNPEAEWIIQEVPELRIIDDALWQRVKDRQRALAFTPKDRSQRTRCSIGGGRSTCSPDWRSAAQCGGGYVLISKDLLGCATARNKGTCRNRLNIRRDALEASVLSGLRTHLMQPELFREFCAEFTAEINRLRMEERASQSAWEAELPRIDRELGKLLEVLKAGGPIETIVAEMKRLETRKAELTEKLADAHEPAAAATSRTWPRSGGSGSRSCTGRCRTKPRRPRRSTLLRSLIDRVTLVPEDGELAIELRGDLGGDAGVQREQEEAGSANEPTSTRKYRWLRGQDLNLRPSGYECYGRDYDPLRAIAQKYANCLILLTFMSRHGMLRCDRLRRISFPPADIVLTEGAAGA